MLPLKRSVIVVTVDRDPNPNLPSSECQDRVKRLAFGVICRSRKIVCCPPILSVRVTH